MRWSQTDENFFGDFMISSDHFSILDQFSVHKMFDIGQGVILYLPTASEGWGEVMFSHVSVCLFTPPSDLLHGGRYAACAHAGRLSC